MNLTGNWVGSDGNLYHIQHFGNEFVMQCFQYGVVVAEARGQIRGNRVQFGFAAQQGYLYEQGWAEMELTADGSELQGYVTSPYRRSFLKLRKQ